MMKLVHSEQHTQDKGRNRSKNLMEQKTKGEGRNIQERERTT